MSKFSSGLGQPGSAGSKSPHLRKELQRNHSCMLRIGERLMRAGSEGNLVQRPKPAQSQAPSTGLDHGLNGQTQPPALKISQNKGNNSSKDPGNSPSRRSSSSTVTESSTERLLQKKRHTSSSLLCDSGVSSYGSAPCSPNTSPRGRVTAAGAVSRDSQLDGLMMQQSDVERKKEVFLDLLKQKYPQHAAIIMGHQDLMRKQAGGPWPSESPIVPCPAEKVDPLASEAMSDGEVLPPTVPFARGCKARVSLPVGRSSGQTTERPPGVLYLQYGEETRQVRMPAEISSQDALRTLFVTAFPHQLTMKMLQSPNMAIYIKDTRRNIYYNCEDVRTITSHCCLKVYHKDPGHVFNRHARPANTEGRISKEVLYSSHSPVHTLSSSSTRHSLQGSMSPPMVRSMPSSPSRVVYGGGSTEANSATLPREGLSGSRQSTTLCTNSSAILERRDVKPDEDAASSKSMALVVRGEGGPHYPDSYCSSMQDRGHLSIPSSQCSAPPSLAADRVNTGVTGIPEGLQQYRASIKPLMGYGESREHQTHSLHRQKSRKYGEGRVPLLGTKSPPPSPQRVNEVRMIEEQVIGGVGVVSPEMTSPMRWCLRRDSNGAPVEIVNRSRGSGSLSSTSSVFMDSTLGQPDRLFQGHVTTSNAQSERMKAMEEQIASLAGLVRHALSMGPDIPRVNDAFSDTVEYRLFNKRPGLSSEHQNAAALIDGFSPAPLALQGLPSDSRLQHSLLSAKRNVNELRLQLNQLRHLQLSNQENVSSMLQMAGQELVLLMCDRITQSEEAAYRQRAEIEEEKIQFLATEERILKQLSELEDSVDCWKRSSGPGQLSVTLKDLEEGAVNLWRAGEAVATLKGGFPELQTKMCSVLKLEVESVSFLREEPQKMDKMLKRVRALTEALSSVRSRCSSEATPSAGSAHVELLKVLETDQGTLKTQSPQSSPKPQPRSSVRPPLLTPCLSGNQADVCLVDTAFPIMACGKKSTAGTMIQPSKNHLSPPLPTHGLNSPSVAKVSPRSREGSPALQKRPGPLQTNGGCSSAAGTGQPGQTPTQESQTDQTVIELTQTCTETVKKQTPEGSLTVETSSIGHSINTQTNQPASSAPTQLPHPKAKIESEPVLLEAPHCRMESTSETREGGCDSASGQITSTASQSGQDTPLDLTQPASVQQRELVDDKPPKLSEDVDSTHFKSADTVVSVQLATGTVEPLPSTERSRRPQMEKPRRSSVDKEIKQSPDRAGKSPPPPPPRRIHAVSSGLTTGRSGEVILSTRKEPDGREKETELPVVPQPKPPRQPPEVEPKLQVCAPSLVACSSPTPATASGKRDKEEEEDKLMKELQVTQGLSDMSDLGDMNKQWKEEVRTSPTAQVDSHNLSKSATSDVLSPQGRITNCLSQKILTVVGLQEYSDFEEDSLSLDKMEKEEEKVVTQEASLNCATVKKVVVNPPVALHRIETVQRNEEVPSPTQKKSEKMKVFAVATSERGKSATVSIPDQFNKEVVGTVGSPTTAEEKVKFTKNVNDITSPDQTNKRQIDEEVLAEKSDVMAVVTLQKENTPEDCSIEASPKFQQDNSLTYNKECVASIPVMNLFPHSHILTHSHGSKQQNQVSSDRLHYIGGGRLSPGFWEDEGPLSLPPPADEISLRTPKTKKEDQAKLSCSDIQTVAVESASPTYLEHENRGYEDCRDSDQKHIIIILNEPMDIESAFKRLSTIFECEEDLDGILPPETNVDEEIRKQEEQKQGGEICVSQINWDLGLKDTGNGHNILFMQSQRPSPNNGPVPEKQDQIKLCRKAETKRKFKLKFPKNKLAEISQAIRTRTTKRGKALEVVVYEEKEEILSNSSPVKETKKQSRRFKINRTKRSNLGKQDDGDINVSSSTDTRLSNSHSWGDQLCKSSFDTIDSLKESIKQLEISVDSTTATAPHFSIVSPPPQSPDCSLAQLTGEKEERERSLSKRPASQNLKGPNSPQSKRAKPQPPLDTGNTSTKKQTSSNSSSSSSHQPSHAKSQHTSCSPEKTLKARKQAVQKQPSQADSRGSRAAGDSNHYVVALRASKIPSLCHSSGRHPSACLSTPHYSDTTNSLQNLSSFSTSLHSASATSMSGKRFLSPPSHISKCPSCSSSPPSTQSSWTHAFLCPRTSLSFVKDSTSVSMSNSLFGPSQPSSSCSSSPHSSVIPPLNLSHLLPLSCHILSPSHANISLTHHSPRSSSSSSSKHQHHLVLVSTSSTTSTSQHSCNSSSSCSSSSPSSSLSPAPSSSSPSSSLLPTMVGHGVRRSSSRSNPISLSRGKKSSGGPAGRVLHPTAASEDAA